jgi:hypothetical protein
VISGAEGKNCVVSRMDFSGFLSSRFLCWETEIISRAELSE